MKRLPQMPCSSRLFLPTPASTVVTRVDKRDIAALQFTCQMTGVDSRPPRYHQYPEENDYYILIHDLVFSFRPRCRQFTVP
jgi:hypothetical protein